MSAMDTEKQFTDQMASAINCFSRENGSNTPDFILAEFLCECLDAFDKASRAREKWYGKALSISRAIPSQRALEIAARVWCDQDMTRITMDADAAAEIARIIDDVMKRQQARN